MLMLRLGVLKETVETKDCEKAAELKMNKVVNSVKIFFMLFVLVCRLREGVQDEIPLP